MDRRSAPGAETRRSRRLLGSRSVGAAVARGFLRAAGLGDADLDRPIIGICNTWSELNPCHLHLRELAQAVKRGVLRAGGTPLEFSAFSIHENLTAFAATPLMYRNLLSMEAEELLLSQPLDAAVLLGGCDKTIPGLLMGAASADLPSVVLAAGPARPGVVRGRRVGCWDISTAWEEVAAGSADPRLLEELELGMNASCGTCDVMGTATTMACLAEVLGMSPPGSAVIPAVDPRRLVAAEEAGRLAVEVWRRGLRPSDVLTEAAFENALRLLHALGGSTNAVIHLIAIARRVGARLTLGRFDALGRDTPFLVNVAPSGSHFTEDFFEAGGVPAVVRELLPLLHRDAVTVTGRTLEENVARAEVRDRSVIASLEAPLRPDGSLVVLRGSLAPDGALLKVSAADAQLLRHRGRAVVFESREELEGADLSGVAPDDVLVLRNQGPVGFPGMPHLGDLPLPSELRRQGVRDMVRISDATISGTRGGTLVVHVAPEAAIGGPLALVRTGDVVELDVAQRRLDVLLSSDELGHRRLAWRPPGREVRRGFPQLFVQHVLQAHEGCDFDFLGRGASAEWLTDQVETQVAADRAAAANR